MIGLKRLFNFYINSSIHVALAVFALTWLTLLQFEVAYDNDCLFFVFFAAVTGYNFVKYFGLAKFHHRGLAGWLKIIQGFSFFAFLGMCYFAFQLQFKTLLIIGGLAGITFLYAIPLIPKKYLIDDKQNLRAVGGVKIYIIALVWTFTTVVLPLINNNIELSIEVWITGVQRFCFVMVLMLPFEIRDLNYDSLKLATIPQKIGIKNTKICGVLLLMVFAMLEFFKADLTGNSIISTLIIFFAALLFLVFSNRNQSRFYSAFWVESVPIFWLVILLMLS